MSAHVMCVTSGSGLPIFSRRKGNGENLPFSVIGSLNGVHMFGKSQKIQLLNTLTDDYCVAWKEFHDSVVLIGVASGCTVEVLNKTLESVFNAIVLIVGIDEIKSQRNIERLKRELRICYPVIDRLLDSLDCGDSTNKHSSDLVGLVETILCTENHLIQIVLDSFTECVDSLYSCVLINGKVVAATDSWWSLNSNEIKLLSLLATVENTTKSKDIPVFLPFKSPTVAFRFVCCSLIPAVQLCCLCGPTPVLDEIQHSATNCFKNSIDALNLAVQCGPRNFPLNCQIDGGILGLLLLNLTVGKYMISRNPHQNNSKKILTTQNSSSHRLDILRTFFYQTVTTFLIPIQSYDDDNTDKNDFDDGLKGSSDNKREEKNKFFDNNLLGDECYWCSEYHKCYALKMNDNIFCVLFNSSIPTNAMRLITERTLKVLLADNKQICW